MITLSLTRAERDLLDDIRRLQFGEIFDVELAAAEEKPVMLLLAPAQERLIEAIREGHRHLHLIMVHNGMPTYAEVPSVTHNLGFKCRRRLKFVN